MPIATAHYFSYRDELSVQDGIIIRGERIVIPQFMRPEIKVIRTSTPVFVELVTKSSGQECHKISEHTSKHVTHVQLNSNEVPERPRQNAGSDISTLANRDYLVTVVNFSQFIEVDYLFDFKISDS